MVIVVNFPPAGAVAGAPVFEQAPRVVQAKFSARPRRVRPLRSEDTMSISLKTFALPVLAASLALATAAAWAQEGMQNDKSMQENMRHEGMSKGMHGMEGSHAMPGTVTAVDTKTGMVDVDSEGMSLRVHFPPSALANLKKGDKITLHMSFSKAK